MNPLNSLTLSLYGTLTSAIPGLDPFLAAGTAKDEAMSQMEKTALARKNSAAQAFQQLQTATQAPLPQQPAFAPSQFFGDLASIISRRPEFQERAQQSTLAKRGEQLRLRAENLQALRDNYLQAAEQAKEIDPLAAIKYREKVATQDKALEQINEQMKFTRESGAKADLQKAELASKEKIAQILANARIQAAKLRATTTANKPATLAERNVLGFYLRAKDSMDRLTAPQAQGQPSLEDELLGKSALSQVAGQRLPNLLKDPKWRQYTAAQQRFTEARLRPESGATIRPDEYAADAKMYFLQPGDDEATLRQKQAARALVLDGVKFKAGKAYDEYFNGPAAQDSSPEEALIDMVMERLGTQ